MKVQVFILLGLMCYSAFSACNTAADVVYLTTAASLGGKDYYIGTDATSRLCCIKEGSAGTGADIGTTAASPSVCTAKGIFTVNSKLWIVLSVNAGATPLATTPAASYTEIIPAASIPVAADSALAIGQVETTALGTTVKGSYIAAKSAVATWTAFTVTGAEICTAFPNLIQIRGNTADKLIASAATAATLSTATGNGVYYIYDTSAASLTATSTAPKCRATLTSPTTNSKQTLGTVEYTIGASGDACCLQTTANQRCYFSSSTSTTNVPKCVPKALLKVDSDVWAVLQINQYANYIDTYSSSGYVDTNLPKASLVADSVAVVKLSGATTDEDFGKFSASTLFAAKDGTTWAGFPVTAATYCSDDKIIQITGTPAGSATLLNDAGVAVTTAKGTGAHLGFTPSTMKATGVAPENQWCTNGASILSIASVVLAFFGLVSL